jgi:hypothetical protein
MVRVRLIRKFADRINGLDISASGAGDLLDLPASEARMLILEGWATAAKAPTRQSQPPQPRRPQKAHDSRRSGH